MIEVTLPPMSAAQTASWHTLLDLGDRVPTGWAVVGGQLVHLHCRERGISPTRPTDDGDAALDVRAHPDMLLQFTGALTDLGFRPGTETWQGYQHRWTRNDAIIDVLIPRHLGARAASRPGIGGRPTIAAPGAQGALNRVEQVQVTVAPRTGVVPRPTLIGAITAKAAALQIDDDPGWRRHVQDLAILSTALRASDDTTGLTNREIARVRNAIGRATNDPSITAGIPGTRDGLARLTIAINRAEQRRQTTASTQPDAP